MIAHGCTSTRRDVAPCTAQAGASGYCIAHDPGAQEARRKGGHATSRAERGPVNYYPPAFSPWFPFWRTPWVRYTVDNLTPGRVGYGQLGQCSGADHHSRRVGEKIKDAGGPGRLPLSMR